MVKQKKARKIDQFTPAPYVARIIKKSFLQLVELCIISCINKICSIKLNFNFLLSVNSPRKIYWDLFVMILATYNCFQIPLEVSFNPETLQSPNAKHFATFIDICFCIDIFVSFRTSYINTYNGMEIMEGKQMAIHYIQGQFTIDFLSTVPFDYFAELMLGEAGLFKLLGALKLVRVLRLNRIIIGMRQSAKFKAML